MSNSELTKKLEVAVDKISKAAANKAAITMNTEFDCLKWKRAGDGSPLHSGYGQVIMFEDLIGYMHPDWIRVANEINDRRERDLKLVGDGEIPKGYDSHWLMYLNMEQILLALKSYHQKLLTEYYNERLMDKIVEEFSIDEAATGQLEPAYNPEDNDAF